jgi:hypothetical protein
MADTVSRFQTEGLDNRLEEVRASVAGQTVAWRGCCRR